MYDSVANEYDDLFSKQEEYQTDIKNLISIILKRKNPSTILDFGCGTGGHAQELLKRTCAKIVCYDISDEMIKVAKKKLSSYSDRVIFTSNINDVLSHKFDVIYSLFYVVNHFTAESDWDVLANVFERSLTRNGVLVFDLWNKAVAIKDPPKSYVRDMVIDGVNYKKSCKAKQTGDFIEMLYEVFKDNSNIPISRGLLKIRLWNKYFISKIFHNGKITKYSKDFGKFDSNHYHYALSIMKEAGNG